MQFLRNRPNIIELDDIEKFDFNESIREDITLYTNPFLRNSPSIIKLDDIEKFDFNESIKEDITLYTNPCHQIHINESGALRDSYHTCIGCGNNFIPNINGATNEFCSSCT